MTDAIVWGRLYTTDGQLPGGRVLTITGQNSGTFSAGTLYEVAPGATGPFVLPASVGTISVTRDAADNGTAAAVSVEYLDEDWYHRQALFAFAAGGANTVSVDLSGDSVLAWRVLDVVWAAPTVNAGPVVTAIAGATQARIGATHGQSKGGRVTVPRGQMLAITGYSAQADETKLVKFDVRGAAIDLETGQRLQILVEARAEKTQQLAEQFVPRPVCGVGLSGRWQTGAVDLWVHAKTSGNVSTQIDLTMQALVILDEDDPDPHPELIPWVATRMG